MAEFFDDLDNETAGSDKNLPFFMIADKEDKVVHDWLIQQMSFLKKENEQRLQRIKNNYTRYKGIQYRDQVYQPRDQDQKRVRYMPQMVVPLISDAVDEKVARLLEYKPGIQVIPQSDETQDKIDSKIAKKFLKHIDYVEKLDEKFRRATQSAKIAGEAFILIRWSKKKGETIVKAGETKTLSTGKTVSGPLREGDVENKNVTALNMLYEIAKSWDEVEYIFYFDDDYTEKLKREYPEKKDLIHSSKVTSAYDFEEMKVKSLEGRTATVWFWHKHTDFLTNGAEIFFTPDTILKRGELPYEHGDLPLERFVDVENEQEQSGESFIEKVKSMASQYNNTKNLITKQLFLTAHPKWFMEGGSVDEQQLNNDTNIVKFKTGAKPPVLAQANPVSPQLIEYAKDLKAEYYEMAKSSSVVRGEPPPGVTAFVALQFVSESENRRISTDVTKTNESIRRVFEKNLKVCGQFYKKTDKRTMFVMGKDNRWTLEKYDPSTLAKPFSLILQNSSALPESKAMRTQFVLDMGKQFPNQFPQEQIAEMLDLGQSEKMLDEAGRAARSAEDENEIILDGQGLPDPEVYEMHIVHWRLHVQSIQETQFKIKATDEVKDNMKDHILAHEMLMFELAQKSTTFAQMVAMQCPQFPLYLELPLPPPMPGMMPPEQGGMDGAGPVEGKTPQSAGPLPGDPAFAETQRSPVGREASPPGGMPGPEGMPI